MLEGRCHIGILYNVLQSYLARTTSGVTEVTKHVLTHFFAGELTSLSRRLTKYFALLVEWECRSVATVDAEAH